MRKVMICTLLYLSACDMGMQGIKDQVAQDAVDQYRIAAQQGDKMQKCVQAGMVAAAYLQAENQQQYNLWKATEAADCAAAGVPRDF